MLKKIIALATFCFLVTAMYGQKDPVLFSVEGKPVNLSEFEYIYTKTNGDKADFSQASLDEYMSLYTKFKLKVQRARDMKLDTIPSLQQELAGYRKQLADSYLTDKEVTERLVKELYERSKKDVDISHIMIRINNLPEPSPQDTLSAYNQALDLMKKIKQGESFSTLARTNSSDPSAKENGGHLGFLTAPLPKGFYQLESAIYSLDKGKIGGPIRSSAGYHIVMVHDTREARGEMEAAHILVRTNGKVADDAKAKTLIDSLYKVLQSGGDFETLAKDYSQDKATADKGGYIGFFGINRYDLAFENAAFAINKDGAYSAPVQSKLGWHIIRQISKKGIEPYDIAKRRLQPKVKKDTRFDLAKASMIDRIKRESNFEENGGELKKFISGLGEDFLTHKWKAEGYTDASLFSFGDKSKFTVADFAGFCQNSSRKRIRGGSSNSQAMESVALDLYQEFVTESTLKYEESQLENKYPEFRSLMREYEEGILLFEATKLLVWDKASQDSAGLQTYFDQHRGDFMWGERAKVSTFTVKPEGQSMLAKIHKYVKKNTPQATLDKFNTPDNQLIAFQEKMVEKGKDPAYDKIDWTSGAITDSEINNRNKNIVFNKIEEVMPPTEKTLQEARGYVIADYQDYLEKEWIKELEAAYKVKVNKKVFEDMVKK